MTMLWLRTFITQIMANTIALVYHRLYDSVTERTKHEAFNIAIYREKSLNPVRSRYYQSSRKLKVPRLATPNP